MHQPEGPVFCKTPLEVQRAHDLIRSLFELVLRTAPADVPVDVAAMHQMSLYMQVLCWILGHRDGKFAAFLDEIEHQLNAGGIELVDGGQLRFPEGVRAD